MLVPSQESVPPVMAFHLGSLGFLTPFKFDTYQTQVTQIIEGTCAERLEDLLLLSLLLCTKEGLVPDRQRRHRAAQPLESASDEGQPREEGSGG